MQVQEVQKARPEDLLVKIMTPMFTQHRVE